MLSSRNHWLGYLGLGLAILASGPIVVAYVVRPAAPMAQSPLPPITGCRPLYGWAADWSPAFVAPDYSVAESYQCEGFRLHVNVVQYIDQHQGKEAVGEFNNVIPRKWWNYTTRTHRSVSDLDVLEYRVELPATRLTIWSWYAVGDRHASTEIGAKFLEAFNALRLRRSATSNLTVAIEADQTFVPDAVLTKDVSAIWGWFTDEMRRADE